MTTVNELFDIYCEQVSHEFYKYAKSREGLPMHFDSRSMALIDNIYEKIMPRGKVVDRLRNLDWRKKYGD